MQRKPGFPMTNCNIKIPDCSTNLPSADLLDDDSDQQQRRLQLINFGHSQWGFNNWSWSVTKQELDFVDFNNGKYFAGVVAFVSITVKNFDIHRENIGYATSVGNTKGFAIYKSRKTAVTNALRETFLSFGGSVASDLMDMLDTKVESVPILPESHSENNPNNANRVDLKISPGKHRKEGPPIARAQPMLAASLPPRAPAPPPAPVAPPSAPPVRPNSNEVAKIEPSETEAARAERKRRQKQAQEEFRLKQMMKNSGHDEKQDLSRSSSSFDRMLLNIPSQDIVIEETASGGDGKRKSPGPESSTKRRNSFNKLNIVQNK